MFDFLQVPDWLPAIFGMLFASGCLGYYIGQRGWAGVKIDLENTKHEISKIKGRLEGQPVVVAPVTPTAPTVVQPISS